ncbi:MAG: phosphotransferase [Actinobacteria bacterium]|nr:phosphotransferase [Actinomycetota bacterium]
MGPTFIKLGQLLSTRGDLLPPAYVESLTRLQDDVEPFGFAEVEQIVTTELGARISKAFADFDNIPLASASLGQVHRATLRDGRDVAVKVQRPGIRERIVEDLEALAEIAHFLDTHTEVGRRYGFGALLEEFRQSLYAELDYRKEAANLATLGEILASYERIVVPQPVNDYTTGLVLTMEFVRGRKITSLGPLAQVELDGAPLADELFRAYLDQVLNHGFFHADPHPGNVFLTDDGRLALIDLGMVARVPPSMQNDLVKLLLAVSEGRGEDAAKVAVGMGERRPQFDEPAFSRAVSDLVTKHQGASLGQIQTGTIVLTLTQVAGECGLRPPPELGMLGKTLLNLDLVARTLDPTFDPNDAIRRNAADILRKQLVKSASPGNVFATMLEAKEFVEKLPGRVNSVMDAFARGEFELKVKAQDANEVVLGVQKLANRVTMGLVIAALIVGAAMLMRVPTRSTLFGYPSIAIVCFLLAAGAGLALVVSIFVGDRKARDRRR